MTVTVDTGVTSRDIATPSGSGGFIASLLAGPTVPRLAARFGAFIARLLGKPIRFRNTILVARHDHAVEVLRRDLEFRIAPINEERICAVNGPFVLGMDRCVTLVQERSALYQALAAVDLDPIRKSVEQEAASRIARAGGEIDVVGDYARPIAAQTARALFGIAGSDDKTFMDVARAIFGHIFLNIGGDEAVERRALDAAKLMEAWFKNEIERRRASGELGTDMMGALMRGKQLDDDGVRRTLGGMLVGSIDTTATCVAKIVAMIAADRALAANVAADLDDPVRLAGWCREALRRWPHNPILLRKAAMDTRLADVDIRTGDQIVVWTQAAMLDTAAFPEPHRLRPDRPPAAYLHFGGGLHPCAGRAVNAFQIPALVGALVRAGIVSAGAVQWAGPFPDHLTVKLKRRQP